jgi:hypothetical protein
MKYLKHYDGEFLGIVGEPTDMTYKDGSNICVGDVVESFRGICSTKLNFIVKDESKAYMMGLKSHTFKNGKSTHETWHIKSHKKFNEHSEHYLEEVSIHTATIHDIAVKCETIEEKFEAIKLMQKLNHEEFSLEFFAENLCNNLIFITELDKIVKTSWSVTSNKIIIDYPTFIKHFDNNKLEVEIKQIDNVVLRRVVKGNENFSCLDFNNYPLWTIDEFSSAKDAEASIKVLQSIIYKINNPKLYLDSLGQELQDGDEIEFIIKDNFDSGIIASKIITINGNLVINFNTMILPEKIDNTKLYIRKVGK